MKFLKTSILLLTLIGTAAAQNSQSATSEPDLTVQKVTWRPISRSGTGGSSMGNAGAEARAAVNISRINEYNSARGQGIDRPAPVMLEVPRDPVSLPSLSPWSGYAYTFTVQNTGAKTMRRVYLEYSYTDPKTQQQLRRREYQSKVKIKPGMMAKLVIYSSQPPSGSVDVNTALPSNEETPKSVVIQKIKYSDGSQWVNPVNPPTVKK